MCHLCWTYHDGKTNRVRSLEEYVKRHAEFHHLPKVDSLEKRCSGCGRSTYAEGGECAECEYKTRLAQSEHSMLVYLCDAMRVCRLDQVKTLCKIAVGADYRSDHFISCLKRFEGLKTLEEVRATEKQLREDLL